MNLVISSTGFKEPGYINIEVNTENIRHVSLPNGIKNIIIHRAFHLLEQDGVIKLIKEIKEKLAKDGIVTIYCLDTYELAHRLHRRDITEAELNLLLYEKGQKNCFSTLFFMEKMTENGFIKKSVSFNDVWSKMEFTK